MVEAKTTVAVEDIRRIVRQIVDRFRPQKVIKSGALTFPFG
jgi:hypothetical protein